MRKVAENTMFGFNYILLPTAILHHKIMAVYYYRLFYGKYIYNQKGSANCFAEPF